MRSEAYSKPAVPMPLQSSSPAWTAPVKCMPPSKRDAPQAAASASTVVYVVDAVDRGARGRVAVGVVVVIGIDLPIVIIIFLRRAVRREGEG